VHALFVLQAAIGRVLAGGVFAGLGERLVQALVLGQGAEQLHEILHADVGGEVIFQLSQRFVA